MSNLKPNCAEAVRETSPLILSQTLLFGIEYKHPTERICCIIRDLISQINRKYVSWLTLIM